MALSIVSITPSSGLTAGRTRVKIVGTDFAEHPWPPPAGPVGDPGPSVKVKFGPLEAENVVVYPDPGNPAQKIIECNTPRYLGAVGDLPAQVDVYVENLVAPLGNVTESNGYTYQHPDAKAVTTYMSVRVLHTLLSEVSRQLPIRQVVQRTHVDFDDDVSDGENKVQITDTPALHVVGPRRLRSNGGYLQGRRQESDGQGNVYEYDRPEVRDFAFDFIIIDDHLGRLNALCDMADVYPEENGWVLQVQRDPQDIDQGFHEFDLDVLSPPEANPDANEHGIVTATFSWVIRGIPIERPGAIEIAQIHSADDDPLALEFVRML